MTLADQVENSTIIVIGKVKEILPSVETEDIIDPVEAAEMREKGYNIVHTDVVIKVDKFLGDNSLDYDEIVVRRDGGRMGEFVRIVKQEHFIVGEKVLLFRLHLPEQMTQVPDGFKKEQYFMFASGSKFVRKQNNNYYSEAMDRVSEKEVYEIIQASK